MLYIIFFVLLFSSSENLFAQFPRYYHSASIDANNIFIPLCNFGNIEESPPSNWLIPNIYNREIIYDYGIGFIGKVNNSRRWALAQWGSMYSPGPIINGEAAMVANPADSLKYRVYKINRGDDNSNPDYAQWPSQWGAPINNSGLPLLKGDQTLWCVYNSYDTTMFRNNYPYYRVFNETGLTSVKLEIQQTVFARNGNLSDSMDIFSNALFFEWTIINKGNENIDSAFFSFWVDVDFSDLQYNAPGFSKSENLAYNWMNKEIANLANPPMAVGFANIYSPIKQSPGDTAIFLGKKKPGFKNVPINYFWPVADRSFSNINFKPAYYDSTFWNLVRGFDTFGNTVIDPTTQQRTFTPLDGDPISQSGWYWDQSLTNGEAGFYIFWGPFNFAAQDTQWIMTALLPTLAGNRFESIRLMREKAKYLQNLSYDSIAFGRTPHGITDINGDVTPPSEFILNQNYPNPFNPNTTISYSIPVANFVTLKIYNTLGEVVATLINNEWKEAGHHNYQLSTINYQLPSGVYFYQLHAGEFIETKKMVLLR